MKRLVSKLRQGSRVSNKRSSKAEVMSNAIPDRTRGSAPVSASGSTAGLLATTNHAEGSSDQAVSPPDTLPAGKASHGPQVNAPLEDIQELNDLVHASPVFHEQYVLDRGLLPKESLKMTLGSNNDDAQAVYITSTADFASTRTMERVIEFIDCYRGQRASGQYVNWIDKLTEEDFDSVLAFRRAVMEPIAQEYMKWALDSLAEGKEDPPTHAPLSRMEETRLMRALYRFQLCCNLFGNGTHGGPLNFRQPRLPYDAGNTLKSLIQMFEPWEIEELACVHAFVKAKYEQIFDEISWDMDEANPKFDDERPGTPEGALKLSNSAYDRATLLEGTTSRGLELLHLVLFKTRDHEHLVTIMGDRITYPPCNFLGYVLSQTEYYILEEAGSERDGKQARREPLPFVGDREPAGNGSYPPLAWTLMWRGTYSNLYGFWIEDNFRWWGYIMWDAARLESTGAKEVLARQIEENWGEDDPRENVD